MDKEITDEAYESLLMQIEPLPIENIQIISEPAELVKLLETDKVIISRNVLETLESSYDDVYLYGFYASNLRSQGESVIVTSTKNPTSLKEKEVGRFILKRRPEVREMQNAEKRSKILVLKKTNSAGVMGYDALLGNGKTIKPARIIFAQNGVVREVLKQTGMLPEPKKGVLEKIKEKTSGLGEIFKPKGQEGAGGTETQETKSEEVKEL